MCWCWDIYYDIRGLILSLPEEMRLSFTTEPGRGSSASDRYHIGLSQNKEKDKISDIQRRCNIKGGDSYSYNAVLAKRQSSPGRSERRSLSISCCILSRWPMATGQALPVLQHLECTVQRRSSLLLPPLRGVLRLDVLPPFLKSEREVGLLLTPPSASIACLLQGIFHPIYTSNHQSAPSSCAMQCCSAMGLVVPVLNPSFINEL